MNKLGLEVYLSILFMLLLGSCTHGRVTEFHPHEEFPGRSQAQLYERYVRLGFVNATGVLTMDTDWIRSLCKSDK